MARAVAVVAALYSMAWTVAWRPYLSCGGGVAIRKRPLAARKGAGEEEEQQRRISALEEQLTRKFEERSQRKNKEKGKRNKKSGAPREAGRAPVIVIPGEEEEEKDEARRGLSKARSSLGGWGREAELGGSFIIRRPSVEAGGEGTKKRKFRERPSPSAPSKSKNSKGERPSGAAEQVSPPVSSLGHDVDVSEPPSRTAVLLSSTTTKAAREVRHQADALAPEASASNSSTFEELGIERGWIEAMVAMGIERPTAIQTALIEAARDSDSDDLLVAAPTGSGKTLAYVLGTARYERVVVAVASRELGAQVASVASKFRPSLACCGGSSIGRQVDALRKRRPELVVGTPGRLCDLAFERKQLKLAAVDCLVIDEADDYAPGGDLDALCAAAPRARRVMVSASATDLLKAAPDTLLARNARAATLVAADGDVFAGPRVSPSSSSSRDQPHAALRGNLAHGRCVVRTERDALDALRRILRADDPVVDAALVFVDDADDATRLADKLALDLNIEARPLSARLTDEARLAAIRSLRPLSPPSPAHRDDTDEETRVAPRHHTAASPPVVVATHLAARGIDAPAVSHVVNYLSVPSTPTQYAHRVGRAGRRPDSVGFAITLARPADARKLDVLARDLGITMHHLKLQHAKLWLDDQR